MTYKRLILTKHATQQKMDWGIYFSEIEGVILSGEIIEEYSKDKPYPSRLILGFIGSRPVHVVVADNNEAKETYVITVYEPDRAKWDSSFRRRLKS